MPTRKHELNILSRRLIVFLSCAALLSVLTGYLQPPQTDEGSAAHIFQLAIVALVPMILLFLATADWTRPLSTIRPLALPAVALFLAFGFLYYLENVRDPNYRRHNQPTQQTG